MELLLRVAKELRAVASKTKGAMVYTKNPRLLKVGLGLIALPEPVTTAIGLPIVAYALAKNSSVKLGEELARSYLELWRVLV